MTVIAFGGVDFFADFLALVFAFWAWTGDTFCFADVGSALHEGVAESVNAKSAQMIDARYFMTTPREMFVKAGMADYLGGGMSLASGIALKEGKVKLDFLCLIDEKNKKLACTDLSKNDFGCSSEFEPMR